MKLSFLQSLDPTTKNSGLTNKHVTDNSIFNPQKTDLTVTENLSAFGDDLDLWSDLCMPFHLLVGSHYSNSPYNEYFGAKGLLDYLIFPLLARKLIMDTYLESRKDCYLVNTLAWLIALPLEAIRLGIGLAITVLLAPVIALTHGLYTCTFKNDLSEEYLVTEEMTTLIGHNDC